jgi:hypothetical protein
LSTDVTSSSIISVIQLSLPPVFLLSAIAVLISALNVRLGRIIDRRRVLLDRDKAAREQGRAAASGEELPRLQRRTRLIYNALLTSVISALLVCLVVASAFLATFVDADLTRPIATLFILALCSLTASLSLFLREVYVAVTTLDR